MRLKAATFLGLAALLATACDLFHNDVARGGGGFEGETVTLAGNVHYSDGTPARNASIRLRTKDFLPGTVTGREVDAITDSGGRFILRGIPEGEYVLESSDSSSHASRSLLSVEPVRADTLIVLPPEILANTGSIRGRVVFADAGAAYPVNVRVIGCEREVQVPRDGDGGFVIGNLPQGTYALRMDIPGQGAQRMVSGVGVTSGDTADLGTFPFAPPDREDLSTWGKSRRIHLNTSPTGAGIDEILTGYPLALRLDSADFDFTQLSQPADGSDFRFSKADGSPLPYEIEYLDAARRRALIWVRVDTVYANDAGQFLVMHWGKPGVFGFSRPGAVFDTADGFAGVWHLSNGVPGGDATLNGNHGLDQWTTDGEGILGRARRFDKNDILSVPDAASLMPSAFTLSCWARRSGSQIKYAKLFFKGTTTDPYASYTLDLRRPDGGPTLKVSQVDGQNPTAESAGLLPDETWTHVAATFDPVSGYGRIYLNGALLQSFKNASAIDYFQAGFPLGIGGQLGSKGPINSFHGLIDEARLSRTVLSPQRLRLDYESQRPGSGFLRFE